MFLITVKLIQGSLTGPEKRELLARLTDAVVDVAGESMRPATWCVVEETSAEEWAVGGETASLDDIRALARAAEPDGGGS